MSSLADLRPKHAVTKRPFRVYGIIIACVFQALVIWALYVGLGSATIDLLKGNIEAVVLQEQETNDTPPPPPPPDFKPPPAIVATPEVSIDLTEAPAPVAPPITVQTEVKPAPSACPVISAKYTRSTQQLIGNMTQFYPATPKRLGQEGTVTLVITIAEEGKVTDASVKASSGVQELDETAIQVVKARFNFVPASQCGKPIAQTVELPIKWQIRRL